MGGDGRTVLRFKGDAESLALDSVHGSCSLPPSPPVLSVAGQADWRSPSSRSSTPNAPATPSLPLGLLTALATPRHLLS